MLAPGEVGDGARHAQDAVQERADSCRRSTARSSSALVARRRAGNAPRFRAASSRALGLPARACWTRAPPPRARAPARCVSPCGASRAQLLGRQARHFHVQVDAIDQRAGNARAVAADALRLQRQRPEDRRPSRRGRGSSPRPAGSAPETRHCRAAREIGDGARFERFAQHLQRVRGPTPAVRRGTARRCARAKSRRAADRRRRRPAPPRWRCGAARGTGAAASAPHRGRVR